MRRPGATLIALFVIAVLSGPAWLAPDAARGNAESSPAASFPSPPAGLGTPVGPPIAATVDTGGGVLVEAPSLVEVAGGLRFDVALGETVASLPPGSGVPDGRLLLAPAGEAVLFFTDPGAKALAIFELASGEVVELGAGLTDPIWSPRGELILVGYVPPGSTSSSVAVADPTTGGLRPLTAPLPNVPVHLDVPAGWIGEDAYYQRTYPDQPGLVELHRVASDGSDDATIWSASDVEVLTEQPLQAANGFLIAGRRDDRARWLFVGAAGGEAALGASPLDGPITQLAANTYGGVVAYAGDGQLVVAASGSPGAAFTYLPYVEAPGSGFAWSSIRDQLVICDGTTLAIYDVSSRAVVATSRNSTGTPIAAPLWLADGIYYVQSGDVPSIRRLPVRVRSAAAAPPTATATPAPDFPATIVALSTQQASAASAATAAALGSDATVQALMNGGTAVAARAEAAAADAAALRATATVGAEGAASALATAEAQAAQMGATATADVRTGTDALAAANAQATAAALAAAATVAAFATEQAALATDIDERTSQQATAAARATADTAVAQATIQALATAQAGLAATSAAQATEAARVGAIATENAASGANVLATAQAQGTAIAEIAAVATANAQSGANVLATAEAEVLVAQTAAAAAQATSAALATALANPTPTAIIVAVATSTPVPTPVASMSQNYVEVQVQVNAGGLLTGSDAAEEDAREALHAALDRYAPCRVGVVSTFGGGDVGEGVAVARAINTLLLDEFPDLFGGAAEPDDFFDQTIPLGTVTLRLYLFSGCVPADTPATPATEQPPIIEPQATIELQATT